MLLPFFLFHFQVMDQYLNFISLENDFFTVKHHDRDSISYYGTFYVILYYLESFNFRILKFTKHMLLKIFTSYFSFKFLFWIFTTVALNKADARDTDIERICDTMVNSLFSFLVTLGLYFVVSFKHTYTLKVQPCFLNKKKQKTISLVHDYLRHFNLLSRKCTNYSLSKGKCS